MVSAPSAHVSSTRPQSAEPRPRPGGRARQLCVPERRSTPSPGVSPLRPPDVLPGTFGAAGASCGERGLGNAGGSPAAPPRRPRSTSWWGGTGASVRSRVPPGAPAPAVGAALLLVPAGVCRGRHGSGRTRKPVTPVPTGPSFPGALAPFRTLLPCEPRRLVYGAGGARNGVPGPAGARPRVSQGAGASGGCGGPWERSALPSATAQRAGLPTPCSWPRPAPSRPGDTGSRAASAPPWLSLPKGAVTAGTPRQGRCPAGRPTWADVRAVHVWATRGWTEVTPAVGTGRHRASESTGQRCGRCARRPRSVRARMVGSSRASERLYGAGIRSFLQLQRPPSGSRTPRGGDVADAEERTHAKPRT